MNIISASNPQWATPANTAINLLVNFEGIGSVPFAAMPADPEPHGRDLYARALAGEFGPVAAYVPPPPQPVVVPASVTMRQARLALLGVGLLGQIEAAIDALPSPQKEAARIEWEYSQEVQRNNGFVSILAPSMGLTEQQLDALFIEAGSL